MQTTASIRTLLLLLLVGILGYCANPVRPEGGPRDETPPQLVPEKSSRNYQTQYRKAPIELTFNEWVEVRDAFNQVVVSPPLEHRYEISIKGKSVIFEFDEREELRENATYTINFGEAIQDITERNPAKDIRYVFSTGDYIDSLSVSGIVVDARTNEAIEGALFLLYDNTADSVVRTLRPFYFGRTGTDGKFLIQNVKADTFKGFALLDNNLNYLFDQAQEAIGFPDSLLVVSDTSQPAVSIRMFTEELPLRLATADASQYGQVKLSFNQPAPENLMISHENISQRKVLYERRPDTTKVWYEMTNNQPWQVYLQQDTLYYDTVDVRPQDRGAFLETASFQAEGQSGGSKLHPKKPFRLSFNHPILAYDTALISLYEDTTRLRVPPNFALDTNGQRTLLVDYKWKVGKPYEMELMPGAVSDIFGLRSDTILLSLSIESPKKYGNLILTVDSLSADSAYIIEILNGEQVFKTYTVEGQASFQRTLNLIEPATYTVQITEDWNRNGEWDTGAYDTYRQPEPMYQRELEQLRANWDLEAVADLSSLQQQARQKQRPPGALPSVADVVSDTTAIDSLGRSQGLPPSVRDRIDKN